jgi:hypothetical protein
MFAQVHKKCRVEQKFFMFLKSMCILGVIVNKKLLVILIIFAVLACSTVVQGEVSVGVKEEDWIEYDVVTTGAPAEGHNIVYARMEVR